MRGRRGFRNESGILRYLYCNMYKLIQIQIMTMNSNEEDYYDIQFGNVSTILMLTIYL